MPDLTRASDEELVAQLQQLDATRAEADARFKAQMRPVADEIERRAAGRRVAAVLEGLGEQERAALRVALEG